MWKPVEILTKRCNMYSFIKRYFDIFFSLLILILLAPLLLPIILALRFTAEGEVFYLQERVGFRNQRFQIFKFATMLKNSPNMKGGEITLRNDPRITPVGRYLRISKLNELPQILNVLFGHMSFVGPRPLMPVSFEQYSEETQNVIYNVKPGITGIGSLIFRDEEKLVTDADMDPREFYQRFIFPYKGQVEMWYQKNQSFYTDFVILLLTALAIVAPQLSLVEKFFPSLPPRPRQLQYQKAVS